MTVLEMQKALKVRIQKLDTNSYADIQPEIYDYYLNIALTKLVKKLAYPKNEKEKGFEQDTKRITDLGGLVLSTILSPSASPAPDTNGSIYLLPTDYWFAVREEILVTYTDCKDNTQTQWNSVIPVTQDRWNRIKDDPFKLPDKDNNIRVTYALGHEIVAGEGTSIGSYKLVYIKKPLILIYDTSQFAGSIFNISGTLIQANFTSVLETNDELTDEIVDLAETLLLENIESKRFQTNFEELIK